MHSALAGPYMQLAGIGADVPAFVAKGNKDIKKSLYDWIS